MHLFPHHRLVTVELQQCVRTTCQVGTEPQDDTACSPCTCSPTTDWSLWNYNSVSEQHVRTEQCIRTAQHVVYVLVPPPLTGHCGIRTIWCKNQANQESIVHQDIIQRSAPPHPPPYPNHWLVTACGIRTMRQNTISCRSNTVSQESKTASGQYITQSTEWSLCSSQTTDWPLSVIKQCVRTAVITAQHHNSTMHPSSSGDSSVVRVLD